jgi:hypothetical protein
MKIQDGTAVAVPSWFVFPTVAILIIAASIHLPYHPLLKSSNVLEYGLTFIYVI